MMDKGNKPTTGKGANSRDPEQSLEIVEDQLKAACPYRILHPRWRDGRDQVG